MLRSILRLAADLGTIRREELARALDTSPELMDLALEELARRDYLQATVPNWSTACAHCPLHTACLFRRQPRVWVLTQKGAACLADDTL